MSLRCINIHENYLTRMTQMRTYIHGFLKEQWDELHLLLRCRRDNFWRCDASQRF